MITKHEKNAEGDRFIKHPMSTMFTVLNKSLSLYAWLDQ